MKIKLFIYVVGMLASIVLGVLILLSMKYPKDLDAAYLTWIVSLFSIAIVFLIQLLRITNKNHEDVQAKDIEDFIRDRDK